MLTASCENIESENNLTDLPDRLWGGNDAVVGLELETTCAVILTAKFTGQWGGENFHKILTISREISAG